MIRRRPRSSPSSPPRWTRVRQGRVHDDRRQGDVQGHRVLVEAAAEGAQPRQARSRPGRPGTTTSATRSATCSRSTSSSPTPARAAIGFTDVACDVEVAATTCPPDEFAAEIDRLWRQVKPLYDQLHCYARRKLNKNYGDKVVPKTGPIPAHLLGNMWAQEWDNIYPGSSRTRASRRSTSRRRSRRATTRRRW